MKTCKMCENPLVRQQKVYCSMQCKGRDSKLCRPTIQWITKACLQCGEMYKLNSKNILSKYCSRECKDRYLKIKFLGENNPSFEREVSDDERKKRSVSMKLRWEDEDYRRRVSDSRIDFVDKNGFWPGTDKESLEKRKDTCIKNYGVSHPWSCPEVRQKCVETTFLRHGKMASHIAYEKRKIYDSSIEQKIEEILIKNDIKYTHPFYLTVENKTRAFDFCLNDYSIIIEADGDYWHANPLKYTSYDKAQNRSKKNDNLKNEMIEKTNLTLLRFWESEINLSEFEQILLEKICLEK